MNPNNHLEAIQKNFFLSVHVPFVFQFISIPSAPFSSLIIPNRIHTDCEFSRIIVKFTFVTPENEQAWLLVFNFFWSSGPWRFNCNLCFDNSSEKGRNDPVFNGMDMLCTTPQLYSHTSHLYDSLWVSSCRKLLASLFYSFSFQINDKWELKGQFFTLEMNSIQFRYSISYPVSKNARTRKDKLSRCLQDICLFKAWNDDTLKRIALLFNPIRYEN